MATSNQDSAKKVLVAFDGSEHAGQMIQQAVDFISRFPGSELVIVTAYKPRKGKDASEAKAKEWLAESGAEATLEGVKYTHVIKPGDARKVLCAEAAEQKANAIVVGSRGRGGFANLLLGSVSQYIIHHAPCAAIVHKKSEKKTFQNFMLCVDMNPYSVHLFHRLSRLLKKDSFLFLLYVDQSLDTLESREDADAHGPESQPILTKKVEKAHLEKARKNMKVLEDLCKARQIPCSVLIKSGTAREEIVKHCKDLDIDFCLMGHHEHSRAHRLFLGSVSDYVVRHAPCTVAVLREEVSGYVRPSQRNAEAGGKPEAKPAAVSTEAEPSKQD